MLYEDFSKEILRWQGIFDGYPENDSSYRLYFELISDDIKDLDSLVFCLKKHHESKNKLFPKPFELIDYAEEFKSILKQKLYDSPFYREILELKNMISSQRKHVLYLKESDGNDKMIKEFEVIIIENENKLKNLEEKRMIALNSKRIE